VTIQTGLSLRAHSIEGVVATELPGAERHIYGEPPDPPATAALLEALGEAAASITDSRRQAARRPGRRAAPLAPGQPATAA